jgi:uncharacterized membrane protein YccC
MSWFSRMFRRSRSAQRTAEQARIEQERATRVAQAAATNAADSEPARTAADERLRRLKMARGLAGTNKGGGAGGASVGYKTVMGT